MKQEENEQKRNQLLYNYIREKMKEFDVTQADVAREWGCSVSAVHQTFACDHRWRNKTVYSVIALFQLNTAEQAELRRIIAEGWDSNENNH